MDSNRIGSGESLLLGHNLGEMLQEIEEEETQSSPTPHYSQQLRGILGREAAEYFLNPPPMEFRMSSSLQRILEGMAESPGAEQLWKLLQEESGQHLHQTYGEQLRQEQATILNNFAQRPGIQKLSRKQRYLLQIRLLSELHQDTASLLLANKPFPDLNDGREGVTKYLTPAPERERGMVRKGLY